MIIIIVIVIAPFRSQIFKIFFASGSKGALTPLTKILRTPLTVSKIRLHGIFRRADVIERESVLARFAVGMFTHCRRVTSQIFHHHRRQH